MIPATLNQRDAIPAGSNPKAARQPIEARVYQVNDVGRHVAGAPDDDHEAWRARLGEILSTNSPRFIDQSLSQLIEACRLPGAATASTTSLSAALELVASLAPENEVQTALALHVAGLHCASMNVLGRLHFNTERNIIAMATAAAKLEQAFHGALETYQRLKSGAHQVVRVERVVVERGGQAIVGVVER